jgi:glycosyltransferase involved in cell wall biosynthesis
MADTLERSLTSILDQIDDRFEVVIVDDGSADDSVNVIKGMQLRYHWLLG